SDNNLVDHQVIVTNGIITRDDFTAGTVAYQMFMAIYNAGQAQTGFTSGSGFNNFTLGLNNTIGFDHSNQIYIMSNSATEGYQALGMSVPDPVLNSLLSPLTTYYFKLAVDGGLLTEYF